MPTINNPANPLSPAAAIAGPTLPVTAGEAPALDAAAQGADGFASAMQMQLDNGLATELATPSAPLAAPAPVTTISPETASPVPVVKGKAAAPTDAKSTGATQSASAATPSTPEEIATLLKQTELATAAPAQPEAAPDDAAPTEPTEKPDATPAPQSAQAAPLAPAAPIATHLPPPATQPAPGPAPEPSATLQSEPAGKRVSLSKATAAPTHEVAPPAITADAAPAGPHSSASEFARALDAAPSPGVTPRDAVPQPAASSFPPAPVISARPGRIGEELGVAIARHVERDSGVETLTVRLDPPEHGRIEVALRFEDGGHLRAHVAASQAATLDLLRRESGDLIRSLAEAGISADTQSFRFESGSESGARQQAMAQDQRGARARGPDFAERDGWPTPHPEPTAYRPLSGGGRIDLMA